MVDIIISLDFDTPKSKFLVEVLNCLFCYVMLNYRHELFWFSIGIPKDKELYATMFPHKEVIFY